MDVASQGYLEIPAALVKTFAFTDDSKSVDGGKRLLVSSSAGGCALLEMPSGKPLWSAQVKNAHSIEALPGGRIAVASSVGGDKIVIFDAKRGDQVLWNDSLPSAHGLVWDEKRKRLFALGFKELRSYSLKNWDGPAPSLAMETTSPLPDDDGHDLRPVPGSDDLVFSTAGHVWLFHRETLAIRPHPDWKDLAEVKSIDIHPATGRAVLIQAAGGNWWSDSLRLISPDRTIRIEGEKLYKARWFLTSSPPGSGR